MFELLSVTIEENTYPLSPVTVIDAERTSVISSSWADRVIRGTLTKADVIANAKVEYPTPTYLEIASQSLNRAKAINEELPHVPLTYPYNNNIPAEPITISTTLAFRGNLAQGAYRVC